MTLVKPLMDIKYPLEAVIDWCTLKLFMSTYPTCEIFRLYSRSNDSIDIY